MGMNVSFHIKQGELTTDFKVYTSEHFGTYPVLEIVSERNCIALYPSFEQVIQLRDALNQFILTNITNKSFVEGGEG